MRMVRFARSAGSSLKRAAISHARMMLPALPRSSIRSATCSMRDAIPSSGSDAFAASCQIARSGSPSSAVARAVWARLLVSTSAADTIAERISGCRKPNRLPRTPIVRVAANSAKAAWNELSSNPSVCATARRSAKWSESSRAAARSNTPDSAEIPRNRARNAARSFTARDSLPSPWLGGSSSSARGFPLEELVTRACSTSLSAGRIDRRSSEACSSANGSTSMTSNPASRIGEPWPDRITNNIDAGSSSRRRAENANTRAVASSNH